MAVVSLSRIQVRRGRKNQGSGLPQLASGEFGWAIDSQELYIGNGAVSEGAPAVGNTKILTDKDNIFDFVSDYVYKRGITNDGIVVYPVQTGPSESQIVSRTLQERLDDVANLKNFGAESGTDITEKLQRALDQLYLRNPLTVSNREILVISPGEYTISSTVYIPPYVTILGAGVDKTIINVTSTGDAFVTVSSERTIGEQYQNITEILNGNITTNNQPNNIEIAGLTIKITDNTTALNLLTCKNSLFQDIKIEGTGNTHASSVGINLRNVSADIVNSAITQSNEFVRVRIKDLHTAAESDYYIRDNLWKDCEFENLEYGIRFGVNSVNPNTTPQNNRIQDSIFKTISRQAIHIANGIRNSSYQNRFFNVGNDRLSNKIPVTPVIQFDNVNNITNQDWFERTYEVGLIDPLFVGADYFPEISSDSFVEMPYTIEKSIVVNSTSPSGTELLVLPIDRAKSFEIDYLIEYETIQGVRNGTLVITVDPVNNVKSVIDEYDFTGFTPLDFFEVSLDNRIVAPVGDSSIDAAVLSMLNSTNNGKIYFKIKSKR